VQIAGALLRALASTVLSSLDPLCVIHRKHPWRSARQP